MLYTMGGNQIKEKKSKKFRWKKLHSKKILAIYFARSNSRIQNLYIFINKIASINIFIGDIKKLLVIWKKRNKLYNKL